jgi:hypothetical protein
VGCVSCLFVLCCLPIHWPPRLSNSPSIGAVDAHFVNLGRVLAEILDVAEDMATAVLTDEVAEICAETHVCHGGLVVTPFLDGEALEEDEALAVDEVCAQLVQIGS